MLNTGFDGAAKCFELVEELLVFGGGGLLLLIALVVIISIHDGHFWRG